MGICSTMIAGSPVHRPHHVRLDVAGHTVFTVTPFFHHLLRERLGESVMPAFAAE